VAAASFSSVNHLRDMLGSQFQISLYFGEIQSSRFKQLIEQDLSIINNPGLGDRFFEGHATFIQSYHQNLQFGLGYEAWLELLDIIQNVNPTRYDQIHKGTAYYHAAIFALRSNRFGEGLELMDYGYTTDLKISRQAAYGAPGGLYLGLQSLRGNDQGEGAKLESCVQGALARLPRFQNRSFTLRFLQVKAKRYFLTRRSASRRSAWVSLLACLLARQENQRLIRVTPDFGEAQTTSKLTLTSLCLILETLLTYSPEGKRLNATQLNPLYQSLIDPKSTSVMRHRQAIYTSLRGLPYQKWERRVDRLTAVYDDEAVAFSVAWCLRNKVNHVFLGAPVNLSLYDRLFDLVVYSILVSLKLLYR